MNKLLTTLLEKYTLCEIVDALANLTADDGDLEAAEMLNLLVASLRGE